MEERLGVRLLQRTRRTVRPTLGGEAWYRRCLAILDDVEDAESAFGAAEPRGLLPGLCRPSSHAIRASSSP